MGNRSLWIQELASRTSTLMLVKPTQLNAYIWKPKDMHNYGSLGFTATPAACQTLAETAQAVVGVPSEHEFDLPETTQADLKHIGDRMKFCYRRLVIGPANTASSLAQFVLDELNRSLRILVCNESLPAFLAMLEEVADDCGDENFRVKIDGKELWIWYWPCFGHVHKTGEPQNRFPEVT